MKYREWDSNNDIKLLNLKLDVTVISNGKIKDLAKKKFTTADNIDC